MLSDFWSANDKWGERQLQLFSVRFVAFLSVVIILAFIYCLHGFWLWLGTAVGVVFMPLPVVLVGAPVDYIFSISREKKELIGAALLYMQAAAGIFLFLALIWWYTTAGF